MTRLGLTVNEEKTKLVKIPESKFDFLGYTIGKFYGKDGKATIGTRPARKSVSKVLRKIHDETARNWLTTTAEKRVEELNYILRGWSNYFNQGPVLKEYRMVRQYTERRLRRWLVSKHKGVGTGYRQYPDEFLYKKLGLYKLPEQRPTLPRAKV